MSESRDRPREPRVSRSDRSKTDAPGSEDAPRTARDAAKTAGEAAYAAGDFFGPLLGGVVDIFGGYNELDRKLRKYNPTFYKFAQDSFLRDVAMANKPSKFLALCILIGIVHSIFPIFHGPLEIISRILGFVFLYNGGVDELKAGFSRPESGPKVKSYLVACLLVSTIQLAPSFFIDTRYHFGALWDFFFPVILFICPTQKPAQTIANIICDTLFSQLSAVMGTIIPESIQGEQSRTLTLLAGILVAASYYTGYIGAMGSYLAIWGYLAFFTINVLGKDMAARESSRWTPQQTIWHNTLAIWLWRYLISTVEGMTIPGVASALQLILYHIPSYFLWVTGFLAWMLITPQTASKEKRADTWYARWLSGATKAAAQAAKRAQEAKEEAALKRGSGDRPPSGTSRRRENGEPDSNGRRK